MTQSESFIQQAFANGWTDFWKTCNSCEPCESTEKRTILQSRDRTQSESSIQQAYANGWTYFWKTGKSCEPCESTKKCAISKARDRTQSESWIQQSTSKSEFTINRLSQQISNFFVWNSLRNSSLSWRMGKSTIQHVICNCIREKNIVFPLFLNSSSILT